MLTSPRTKAGKYSGYDRYGTGGQGTQKRWTALRQHNRKRRRQTRCEKNQDALEPPNGWRVGLDLNAGIFDRPFALATQVCLLIHRSFQELGPVFGQYRRCDYPSTLIHFGDRLISSHNQSSSPSRWLAAESVAVSRGKGIEPPDGGVVEPPTPRAVTDSWWANPEPRTPATSATYSASDLVSE